MERVQTCVFALLTTREKTPLQIDGFLRNMVVL
jgi:hypothetical protein